MSESEVLVNIVEKQKKALDKSLGIFKMSKYYWEKYVGTCSDQGDIPRLVACLGAGDTLEMTAFAFAVAGKTQVELTKELLRPPSVAPQGSKRRLIPYQPQDIDVKTYAFDYSLNDFDRIKKNPVTKKFVDKAKITQADIRALPVANSTFDICVVRNPYWDELEKAQELDLAFAEIDRVTKENGILWMTFLSEEEFEIARGRLAGWEAKGRYRIKYAGESGFQTIPGEYIEEETGEKRPYPWDKYILIATKIPTESI